MEKISICIVAYNEEKFLPKLLNNLKNQVYPHKYIEIVLVDSESTDKTKKIMKKFQEEDNDFYSVQVINNPKKIQASGWNIAISYATGEVIARIDAHTILPPDFSTKVMKNINTGEYVVGGIRPCVIERDTAWSKTLLQAENSMFGSSINISKRSSKKEYVKTMFHAAYRREVFDNVGLFNEKLLRTEDNEMHYRIRKFGYKLCYDPDIMSFQYARKSLKDMIVQKYKNGFWVGLTLGVCPGCISVYHIIPALFIIGICLTTIFFISGYWQLFLVMWIFYGGFAIGSVIISIIKNGFSAFFLLMPVIFLILHISYGIGTLVGILKIPEMRKKNKI